MTIKQDTKEFIENEIVDISKIYCAEIEFEVRLCKNICCTLKTKFSIEEYNEFLDALDYESNEITYISGIIWFRDGNWATYNPIIDEEPSLYGYSWHLHICPHIPENCKRSE